MSASAKVVSLQAKEGGRDSIKGLVILSLSRGVLGVVAMSLHQATRYPCQASFSAILSEDVRHVLILVDSEVVREGLLELLSSSSGVG